MEEVNFQTTRAIANCQQMAVTAAGYSVSDTPLPFYDFVDSDERPLSAAPRSYYRAQWAAGCL